MRKKAYLFDTHSLIPSSATELINSTLLPDHHKYPFDRILVAQANHKGLLLVTKDLSGIIG